MQDAAKSAVPPTNLGRNIHFGIREHSMGAICNGLALYLESPVFCSTFLAFSNYMMPAIRMSAMMSLPVMYEFTHDSFKVGEDGATHQPIEQLGQLRLIPNLNVFRPADANELIYCYKMAFAENKPSAFALTRQTVKTVTTGVKNISRGGYVLSGAGGDISIFASGSEVALALQVAEQLKLDGFKTKVCSFPCLEVFEQQNENYKQSVLSGSSIKVVIEASNDNVWYKYLTNKDLYICADKFGESGSIEDLDKYYGFTVNNICKKIKNALKK